MKTYTPPFTITEKILSYVSKISEYITKLEMIEPKSIAPTLRKANKIKTITGTLEIEGNTIGVEKITALIEGKKVLGLPREIAEVQGAIKVYDYIEKFDYKSLDDLLMAHKILMSDILVDAGRFRNKDVGVGSKDGVVHIAPPSTQVSKLMNDLFLWLKSSDIHPLIKSSVFHYEFEFIHPFIDGNGRVGRLWQSLILYNWKPIFIMIPVESVVRDAQERYYKALEDSGSIGESTPFIEFMLEAIMISCQNVLINDPLNVPIKRIDKIVELIKKTPKITIAQLALRCEVSEKSIKRDIAKLKEQGKLKRVGSLKSGHWEVLL